MSEMYFIPENQSCLQSQSNINLYNQFFLTVSYIMYAYSQVICMRFIGRIEPSTSDFEPYAVSLGHL